MNICNYTMGCRQFKYDFAKKNKNKPNQLIENNGIHSYFSIPNSKKYYMKISYSNNKYTKDINSIKNTLWIKFILATVLLFCIALFFTFYSLYPIRRALQLNDEFIKDILHDFNTPITSMILNIRMFTEEKGEDIFIKRISHSINNIMLLQNNLKCFLQRSVLQNTQIDIAHLIEERMLQIQENYPLLTFTYQKNNTLLYISNKEMLIRIFDNLLSNASKYNKPHGEVKVTVQGHCVLIQDTGKGIQNINKITQRYYKEQERGLGLGLHIVQKLIDELHIQMHITSKVGIGSTFTLDFKALKKETDEI